MKDYKNEDFLNKILNAIKKQRLILFVGAGVSKLCGLPLWYDLAVQLLDYCTTDKAYDFSNRDKELLLSSVTDARELITIVSNIMKRKNIDDFYHKVTEALTIKPTCLNDIEKKNLEIIPEIIKSLGNTIITTNADTIIDEKFDGKSAILYKTNDISKFNVTENKQIFHIHGSINKPDEMIFNTVDYLKRYNSTLFSKKMINIFNNLDPDCVILIIGYSLSELQLLDFIIKDEQLKSEERLKKTFLLNGYYSYQENVFEAEEEYYKTYGITLLSYCKDNNGYQGLVDALNDIKTIAYTSSQKEIVSVNRIINLFNKKPTKAKFDSFLNSFDEFDTAKQNFIFSKLLSSSFLSEWLSQMFKNESCYNKYFNFKTNLPKLTKGESFPGCIFLTSVKCDSTRNKNLLKMYFKGLVEEYLRHRDYFKNEILTRNICKALMTNKEYIEIAETFKFIQIFNEQVYREYWILFLCHDNNILNCISKKSFIKYVTFLLKSFKENGDKEYYFELFFNTCSKRIGEFAYKEIFEYCKNIIDNEVLPTEKPFLTRDTFDEIFNGDDEYYPIYKIYKVFLFCLSKLPENELINFYNYCVKHKSLFYKQLSIYTASLKYEIFEELLFKQIMSYTSDRKFFAEIYSCFKRNKSKISIDKVQALIDFISAIKFDNFSEIWDLTAKKYLLDLLDDLLIFQNNEKFKLMKASNNALINEKYKSSITTMPSALNMSKSIWSGVSSWKNDDSLKKELNKLDNNEFYKKIIALNLDDYHIKENVTDSLKHHITNGFIEYLESSKLLGCLDLKIVQLIIDALAFNEDGDVTFCVSNIIKLIDSIKNQTAKLAIKENTLSTLSFLSYKLKDLTVKNLLFNFALDDIFVSKENWSVNGNVEKKDINTLFSVKPFDWLNLLINCCNKAQWNILKTKILKFLEDKNKQIIVKGSLAANIHILWYLDKKFVIDNLFLIFNNVFKSVNYSHISFEFSQFYNPEFISELFNQKLLENLLNDENFSLNYNYCYLITMLFIERKLPEEILLLTTKTTSYRDSLFSIVSELKKIDCNLYCKQIDNLFRILSNSSFDEAGHSAIELFKMSKHFSKLEFYPKALIKLFSGKNTAYYVSDLKEALVSSKLTMKENELIIVSYLNNVGDTYYYEEEIADLINSFSWSSEKIKIETINKLGNVNPNFLTLFK